MCEMRETGRMWPARCKVYTKEELKILNRYYYNSTNEARGLHNVTSQIHFANPPAKMFIPTTSDELEIAVKVRTLQHLEGKYYEATLEYCDEPPFNTGYTKWVVKLSRTKGFLPLMRAW